MMANVTIDGETVEHGDYPEAPEHVLIEFDTDDAYRFRCAHCGEYVDDDGNGHGGSDACDNRCGECGRPLNDYADPDDAEGDECDGIHVCAEDCDAEEYECDSLKCHGITPVRPTHVPEPLTLGWVNSAGISVDESGDSITTTISVGDPRGAFAFTVRRVTPDEGQPYLIMHTPYPGMGYAHMPVTELHSGTYRIMSYGWTPPVEPEPEPEPLPWHKRLMGRFTAAWVAFWL